jgi:hypothetical protein
MIGYITNGRKTTKADKASFLWIPKGKCLSTGISHRDRVVIGIRLFPLFIL